MEARINNLRDLQVRKAQLKQELKQTEHKLKQHYQDVTDKLETVSSIVESLGWFSGKKDNSSNSSGWVSVVGSVLKVSMPFIIARLFNRKVGEGMVWAEILKIVGGAVDKDLINKIVEVFAKKGEGPQAGDAGEIH